MGQLFIKNRELQINIGLEHDMGLDVCKSKMVACRYSHEQRNVNKQTESNCKNLPLAGVTEITVAPEWKAAPPNSWLGSIV